MKKVFALVLALVLLLTAVSVFAEGSKEEPGGGGAVIPTTPKTPEISVKFIDDTEASAAAIKAFADAKEAGDILAPLPEDVRALVPEGFVNINELVTAQFEGKFDNLPDVVILNVMFQTSYAGKDKVIVLIGILPAEADGKIEWQAFNGVGKDDGSVDVTLPREVFDKIQTNPFLIGVISD